METHNTDYLNIKAVVIQIITLYNHPEQKSKTPQIHYLLNFEAAGLEQEKTTLRSINFEQIHVPE